MSANLHVEEFNCSGQNEMNQGTLSLDFEVDCGFYAYTTELTPAAGMVDCI